MSRQISSDVLTNARHHVAQSPWTQLDTIGPQQANGPCGHPTACVCVLPILTQLFELRLLEKEPHRPKLPSPPAVERWCLVACPLCSFLTWPTAFDQESTNTTSFTLQDVASSATFLVVSFGHNFYPPSYTHSDPFPRPRLLSRQKGWRADADLREGQRFPSSPLRKQLRQHG